MNNVCFADFERLLLKVGFHRAPTVGPQMFYKYFDSDTWILLPFYAPDAKVRLIHLVAARRLLDERGLLEESDFDRLLADAAPKSNANCASTDPETNLAAAP